MNAMTERKKKYKKEGEMRYSITSAWRWALKPTWPDMPLEGPVSKKNQWDKLLLVMCAVSKAVWWRNNWPRSLRLGQLKRRVDSVTANGKSNVHVLNMPVVTWERAWVGEVWLEERSSLLREFVTVSRERKGGGLLRTLTGNAPSSNCPYNRERSKKT